MATNLKAAFLTLTLIVATHAQQLYEGDKCSTDDGKIGTCKNIEQCQVAKDELNSGKLPKICGFVQYVPIVCCTQQPLPNPSETRPTMAPTPGTTPKPGNNQRKSQQKCQEYAKHVYVKGGATPLIPQDTPSRGESQCVDGSKTLIIGGTPAEPKEFPHMANVGFGDKNSITWACGGSLISERFVLTAAHCLTSRDWGLAKWVRLGELNLKRTDDATKTQDFSIVNMFRHPGHKGPAIYNDIALLQLDRDAKFNGYVRPACVHAEEKVPDLLIATGWGLTDWVGSKGSDELQKVPLNNVDPAICNDTFSPMIGGRKLRDGITAETMLCVGDLNGGKDTCKGDSGGPLQVKMSSPYCMYDIVGITSFGGICGARNSPAVYTRISHFIPWIESIVWP